MTRFRTLRFSSLLLCAAVGISLSSCGNSDKGLVEIVHERDSLKTAYENQKEQLETANSVISSINNALNSITHEEGMIFANPHQETPIKKEDILENLKRYESVLNTQRDKIKELEDRLAKEKNNQNSNLAGLVAHMKQQLAEKDAQIAKLKAELSQKNVDISKLRRQVESQEILLAEQSLAIEELDRKSHNQTKALKNQDDIINTCYVIIGSKSDLKSKGIVVKNKIRGEAALDKSKFVKVDIRKFREISFEAKRPRILTNMPTSSYMLTTNGKRNFTLTINDATAFWSISNFLIIQTD